MTAYVLDLEFSANGSFLRTNVGSFALQAGPGGLSGDDPGMSRLHILGCLWPHHRTIWPPPGHLFVERTVAARGPELTPGHSPGAIQAMKDDNQYGSDGIESPIDPSTTPPINVTSGRDIRTSHLRLQGDWIYQQNHRMIWLPTELRPVRDATAVRGSIMAVGHIAGKISFWEASD